MAVQKTAFGTDPTMVGVVEDRLSMLKRMWARLGETIDQCGDSRSLCLLMGRLQSVLGEIDSLSPGDGLSPADEIARCRQERRGRGEPVSVDHSVGQGVGCEHR
jgi:hypothetical protein